MLQDLDLRLDFNVAVGDNLQGERDPQTFKDPTVAVNLKSKSLIPFSALCNMLHLASAVKLSAQKSVLSVDSGIKSLFNHPDMGALVPD